MTEVLFSKLFRKSMIPENRHHTYIANIFPTLPLFMSNYVHATYRIRWIPRSGIRTMTYFT